MKRLFLFLSLFGVVACTQADALEYNADVNRGACATNFSRYSPGVCYFDGTSTTKLPLNFQGVPADGSCASHAIAASAKAKSIALSISLELHAKNAIGQDHMEVDVYLPADTTCSGQIVQSIDLDTYEYVAKATSTIIGVVSLPIYGIPYNGSTGLVNIAGATTSSTLSNYSVTMISYTD